MAADPFAPHLERARALFGRGEVLQAGQIWQAILKRQADHAEARAGLVQVKRWMEARKAAPPPAAPPPAPAAVEPPSPYATRVFKSTVPYKPVQPAEAEAEEPAQPRPAPPPPRPVLRDPDELEPVERLLKEGCTLYDMGQAEDALLKWEQILAQDPHHALALEYVAQARLELGFEIPAFPAPAAAPLHGSAPVTPVAPEELLRRASQLYEMGSLEQSIAILEQILAAAPGNPDAQLFLRLAQRELAESTPPVHVAAAPAYTPPPAAAPAPSLPPPPLPGPPSPPVQEPPAHPSDTAAGRGGVPAAVPGRSSDALEQKLAQGERLLQLGRFEEAGFAFQMALSMAPGESRATEGLRKSQSGAQSAPAAPAADATLPGVSAALPVQPPAALTTPAAAARTGPALPMGLQGLAEHPLLTSNRFLAGGAALVVALAIGIQALQTYRRDDQLRSAVARARETAVAPAAQSSQPLDLEESLAALRQEADAVLAFDPVRAYHRAKEILRRDPADAVGAALMEKAKAALLADPVPGVSLSEFQRLLASGDLEGAERAIDALLRAKPDDPDLVLRAARLERVLAGLHASKGEWAEAKTALQKGRAFFPEEKSWGARIHLLDRIQGMPKAEHPGWLPFLG